MSYAIDNIQENIFKYFISAPFFSSAFRKIMVRTNMRLKKYLKLTVIMNRPVDNAFL